ncbi:kinase-like domain-containing protein [Neocallimastix lanati (nom. inval.)]|jgi:casein kinase II subunit alpha|nr:kinase-like domain-containing protein [Neocallimastix sp. JGI-2020a]
MSSSPYNYSEKYSLPEYNYKSHPKASYEKNSFSIASLHFCKKAIIWIFSLKPRSLSRSTFGVAFGYFFYIFKFICLMYFIFSKLGFLGSSNKNKAATSNIGPNRESPEYKNIVQKIFTTSAIPQDSYLTGEINPPRNMSRVFAHVNEKMPREYWDWENTTLQFSDNSKYIVDEEVGRGKFSNVYKCKSPEYDFPLVMKVFKPERTKRIRREILILKNLKGGPNIIPLIDVIKDQEEGNPTLVFPYIDNNHWKKEYPTFDIHQIKKLIFELLKALQYCHSKGIMHRDVKPHNVCIDKNTREVWLIDWGLADFYHVGVKNNVRVASRYYKAPEQLVNYQLYDYSLDMWSLGVVLAGLIFRKEFFFKGDSDEDQLVKIMSVLGTDDLRDYIKDYEINLSLDIKKIIEDYEFEKLDWSIFINEENKRLATKEAVDLVDHLLRYDHQTRLTAEEAMAHPFFDEVRNL